MFTAEKLNRIIAKVAQLDYMALPERISIKSGFITNTFEVLYTNGFHLTLSNRDGDYWHIEIPEDEEVIDLLYAIIFEPQTKPIPINTILF